MKKILSSILSVVLCLSASAQMSDAQKAAAEAAKAITDAPQAEQKVEKPKYWSESLTTNIKFGQTSLTNWAAGGDNTVTLQAFIDGNANYKKNNLFWNNRLQLDYGFVYASSKPILQKSDDRIYLESKFGYKNPTWKNFSLSVNYDFKSQFSTGYDYLTPAAPDGKKLEEMPRDEQIRLWNAARNIKSDFLAPAYTNLAVGIDLKPFKWLSLNIAPLTGGVVIVGNETLRKNYGMELKDTYTTKAFQDEYAALGTAYGSLTAEEINNLPEEQKHEYERYKRLVSAMEGGSAYRSARFEFGAQVKADVAVNVNDNFKYTSQLVLFSNYLDHPENLRVNWDNRFDWKLAKYFSLTLTTNLIYDDKVLIFSEKDGQTKQRVQFKESLLFGFTYTIASKK
ncbi:MAG: DUF3078 domain-containing protein [Bacteroidales bacterium]|nr:DUF3078 domain-containing protein [Bacteroidales bacterium]